MSIERRRLLGLDRVQQTPTIEPNTSEEQKRAENDKLLKIAALPVILVFGGVMWAMSNVIRRRTQRGISRRKDQS